MPREAAASLTPQPADTYCLLMVMLPLTVPMSSLAAPEPILPWSLLRFCSEIVTGKPQDTLPLTE